MIILPIIFAIGALFAFGMVVNAIAYIKMNFCHNEDPNYANSSISKDESELSLNYSADDEDPLFDDFPDYPHSI